MEKTRKMKSKNKMEKELKKFYKEIAKALPAEGRKTLIPGIQAGVESFLAENPDAAIEDVIAYVGTPVDIAGEYYATQEGAVITRKINLSRIILITVVSVVSLALLIYAGFMLYLLIKDILTYPAYSIEGPAIVVSTSELL